MEIPERPCMQDVYADSRARRCSFSAQASRSKTHQGLSPPATPAEGAGEPRALQGHADIAMALVRLEREREREREGEHRGFPSRATRGPFARKGFAFLLRESRDKQLALTWHR